MKKCKIKALPIVFAAYIIIAGVLLFALPKANYSQNEKRVLSDLSVPDAAELVGGEYTAKFESFVADHFPFRDAFVGINSYFSQLMLKNGSNGVYNCKDGYLIAEPKQIDAEKTAKNIKTIDKFAKKLGVPASLIIVPTPGYALDSLLPPFHKQYNDDVVFDAAKQNIGSINLIDLREDFRHSASLDGLYYKTDHHLTARGSLYLYNKYCDETGIEKKRFSCAESYGGFYGTAYSSSGLWLSKPDAIDIYKTANPSEFSLIITDGGDTNEYNSLYFYDHLKEFDKYPVFLDGNHGVEIINNKSVHNGKKLLLIKDSYAHCAATYLAENFEEIIMVDMRYFRGSVKKLAGEQGANELLFIYGCENISGSTDISWLNF